MLRIAEMYIMVIVPAGNRINHLVARINRCAVQRIDERPAATGDEDLLCIIIQALPGFDKGRNRFPQIEIAFCGRVGSESVLVCMNNFFPMV
jgi:hypothetical protein